jgi:hypothetical protein
LLRKELEKLSPNFHEVLILREIERIHDREIADSMAPVRLSASAALQILLMDVAAIVDAAETSRSLERQRPEWTDSVVSTSSPPGCHKRSTAGNNPGRPEVLRGERKQGHKERKMNVVSGSIVQKQAAAVAVLLAFFVVISLGASAKCRAAKPAPQAASLIAHLALPGAAVIQLDLQQHGNKQYLYVERASKEGFAIVDVTKPDQPNVIKRAAWPNQASAGKLQRVSSRLALIEATGTAMPEINSSSETLKVLDLSDPANPRTILTFAGVTSTLADDARSLVYITNSEGLWILKHLSEQEMSPETHACSSEDAANDVASCQ